MIQKSRSIEKNQQTISRHETQQVNAIDGCRAVEYEFCRPIKYTKNDDTLPAYMDTSHDTMILSKKHLKACQ